MYQKGLAKSVPKRELALSVPKGDRGENAKKGFHTRIAHTLKSLTLQGKEIISPHECPQAKYIYSNYCPNYTNH